MAVKYTVERWPYPTSMKATSFQKFSRKDGAANALYDAVQQLIADNALRDTKAGWKLYNEMLACEVSPPKRGYMRFKRFEYNGDCVIFSAIRV